MFDYVRGMQRLKKCIADDDLQVFHILEGRLLENLQSADLYGTTPTSNADKYAIISQLNKLALRYGRQSFNDMCNDQPVRPLVPETPASLPVSAQEQLPAPSTSLIAARTEIELLAPVVPTAYCKNLAVEDFPLLQVTIDTSDPQCGDAVLQIHTWIEDYSDKQIKTISLPHGQTKQVMLFPLFKHETIKTLNDVRLVTLYIRIEHTKPVPHEYYETKRVRLLAYNAALLSLELQDETVVDLSHYLAAWVTPQDQSVQKFLKTVALHHPEHKLEGYPDSECADPASFVRQQVQATYEALKQEIQMMYADSSLVIGNLNQQIVQRVKLPSETLASGGIANCLDGTVLFASILEAIKLQPLIILERSHAYLGWKIFTPGKPVHYEFLETTLIDTDDFASAQQRGLERYQHALDQHLLEHKINDMEYARQIDVVHWHQNGIHPLS